MKRFLLLLLALIASPLLHAQSNGIDQPSDFLIQPTGEKFLRWDAKLGRSYFIQISDSADHLRKWYWAPVIEQGFGNDISFEVDGTAEKGFFRLKYDNKVPVFGDTLESSDYDADGIVNWEEISPSGTYAQTDPLNADSDGDQMKDGFERANGFDPNNPDENANSILDGLEDFDGDGILNGSDTSPRDFFNQAMPRLGISGNMEVKVTAADGSAISGAPVKFTRTSGTGFFPGSITSLTRTTTSLGVISVSDYSFGTNDAIKATLTSSQGQQTVWLPGGISNPSYGTANGGGALSFTAPTNIGPPPDPPGDGGPSPTVLPIQNYLKYYWEEYFTYSGGWSKTVVENEPSQNNTGRLQTSTSSGGSPYVSPNKASIFTTSGSGEEFYALGRDSSEDPDDYHPHIGQTITAKMGLANLPTGFSNMKVQRRLVYSSPDRQDIVVDGTVTELDLTSTLKTVPFLAAGQKPSEAAVVIGPFLSGMTWEELEADTSDSSIKGDLELPVDGDRTIMVQALVPNFSKYWVKCEEGGPEYAATWEVSSSNPDITATFVNSGGIDEGTSVDFIHMAFPEQLKLIHNGGNANSEANITVGFKGGTTTIISKTFHVHLVADEADKPKLITASQTNDEAAGPKYRKIGLTGVPLSDEKPQATGETDEEQEETYVDALTRELRHSTTDVYVPVPASELSLTVRRNAASEIWSLGSGLTPAEDPTLAFGAAWRSNLGGHIRMVEQTDMAGNLVARMNLATRKALGVGQSDPNYAFVTDETGSTHRFAIGYLGGNNRYFVPMPTSRNEQDAYQMSLVYTSGQGFVFTRKHGNTLRFGGSAAIRFSLTSDRLAGSKQYQDYQYFRLETVADRFGNQLNYSYSGTQNLVPSTIAVAGRPDLSLKIVQNSQGRVTAVYDPNGNATTYSYPAGMLGGVTAGGRTVATYTYEETQEDDHRKDAIGSNGVTSILPWNRQNPAAPFQYEVKTGQINVKSIADAYGRTTSFNYNWDLSYSMTTGEATYGADNEPNGIYSGPYTLSGIPRDITGIQLPGSRSVAIGGPSGKAESGRQTIVTDAAGHTRTYAWGPAVTYMVDPGALGYEFSETQVSTAKINYFTQMTLSHAEGGSESYSFNINSGLSLQSVTDYSGNTTSYGHGETLTGTALPAMGSLFGDKLGLGALTWSEPTSQTDALNRITRYAYGPYRVMTTSIAPDGVRTDNDVDSLGRRIKEEVKNSSGNILKKTEFAYHTGFPNFLIRQTVKNVGLYAANDPAWVAEMTTLYEPDSNGRVQREATDMNGNNVIDAGDLITSHTYDKSGNKLSATAPDGLTTWFQYDARHRLVKTIFPDGSSKESVYDKSGKKVLSRDENGHASGFVYDGGGRLVKTVRDMNGNLAADVDALTVDAILSGITVGTDLIEQTAYTAINLPSQKTDARGYVSVTEYDHLRRPTKTIAPGVSRAAGAIPDGSGDDLVTQLFYDGPNSGASSFDQSGFKPTRVVDPRGYTTINLFDKLYRQTESRTQYQLSPARYARTVNSYDLSTGNLTDSDTYRDPFNADGTAAGSQQRYSRTHTLYDALKRPTTVYQGYGTALQSSIVTAYTSTGLAHRTTKQLTSSEVAVSDSEYDVAGRATKVIGPAIPVFGGGSVRPITLTSYTPTGLKASVTDPRSFVTDFRYDVRGRLVQTLQPEAYDAIGRKTARAISTTIFDRVGNAIATIDPRGFQTDTTFDAANRATDVYSPAVVPFGSSTASRPHTQTIYDPAGNILQLIDPNGNATVNSYDSLGRLATTKTNPTVVATLASHTDDITVTNQYDKSGNLIQVTDGREQITRFEFDGLKRSTATVWDYGSSRARTVSTEYDAAVKTATVDSRNWRTEFGYDDRFRLISSTCASRNDDNETWSYDLADRILSINRASGTDARNVSYQYNAAGWITQETSSGITTFSAYDLSGNRRLVTYPLGARQLVTTFDQLNRVLDITETKPGVSGERKTAYFYDLAGNRVRSLQPNGSEELTDYDGLSRKTSLLTRHYQSEAPVSRFLYQYDLGSSVRQISEDNASVPDRIVANSYDRVYRLTSEVATTGSKVETSLFVYDKAHNRTGRTRTVHQSGSLLTSYADTFTYGNATNGKNSNQLTLYHDAKRNVDVTYFYDLNGNRYQRLENGSPTHTYVWDSKNRLIEATAPSGTSYYGYDYRTRRVIRNESTAGGTSTVITFSGGTSVMERTSGTTTPTVEYIRGSDWGGGIGGILYTIRGGVSSHSAYNSRGDVVAKTDSTGSVTWQASYEAFGTRTAEQGTNADRQRANTKEEDPTGLLNEGFRYRDLETGLFISRDPAGFVDGPNVYTYVRQNPWSAFDPEGLEGEPLNAFPPIGDKRSMQQIHEGKQAEAKASRVAVPVGVAMVTGGLLSGPAAAATTAVLGDTALAGVVSAGTVGVVSSVAANSTSNVMDGRPVMDGTGKAALLGGTIGVAIQTGANLTKAFMQGYTSGAAAGAEALTPSANATLQATTAEVNATKGPIQWVNEGHGNPAAAAYEAGAAGNVPGKAPRLSATDSNGTVTAKFDGVEGSTMIDRKLAVTTFPKSENQMLRQSATAAENGYGVRWEVPNTAQQARAQKMAESLGVKNVDVQVRER